MRALVIDRFGSPEVMHLAEVPTTAPGATDVLIRVIAAGVNPIDYKMRDGSSGAVAAWTASDFPAILGRECCGIVEAVGAEVDHVQVGDRVFAVNANTNPKGTYADYALMPGSGTALAPEGVDAHVLAGTALAGLTAWSAVHDQAKVGPDDTVLVHGAGGGVGQIITQLALATGARVYASASPRHHDRLEQLGATHVDYTTCDVTTVTPRPSVIIDGVYFGTYEPSLDHLAPGGRMVVLPTLADLGPAHARGIDVQIAGFTPDRHRLDALAAMLQAGSLTITVGAVFPLGEAAAAHELLQGGHADGKIVLDVAP